MDAAPLKVLFVCSGSHVRSLMAQAITARVAPGKFLAFSAGSQLRDEIDPFAARLLASLKHDLSGLRPKSWHEFTRAGAPALDFVFTLSETVSREGAPNWPGKPATALWLLPDPAAFVGDEVQKALAFADAYRMLHNRISIFASLPFATLRGMALQHRLDAIGKDADPHDPSPNMDAA